MVRELYEPKGVRHRAAVKRHSFETNHESKEWLATIATILTKIS
jgi:hypothetical protein